MGSLPHARALGLSPPQQRLQLASANGHRELKLGLHVMNLRHERVQVMGKRAERMQEAEEELAKGWRRPACGMRLLAHAPD